MKRWYGKFLGLIAGALLLRGNPLLGGLIGLLVGHAFDADWIGPGAKPAPRGDDPYRVLGLTADADDAEIDLAYRRKIGQVHPDRFHGAAPDLRREAEAKAREINRAYDRIKRARSAQRPAGNRQ